MRGFVMVAAIALLAACKQAQPGPAMPTPTPTVKAAAVASASAAPMAEGRSVKIENRTMSFEYSYPAAAAAIPALKAKLDANIKELLAETRQGAKELAEMDREAEGPPRELAYSHSTEWKVVADLPGWLSMNADRWDYTGGAHGNPWSAALLWDRTANVERSALDLFGSNEAFKAAIGPAFCAALDKARVEKRGEADFDAGLPEFNSCVDPAEATIMLGSADHRHFTRIGFKLDPYVAGPYAEGYYEVTLPVTPAVLAAVRPEFRASFALAR